eukprot:UN26724
MEVFRMCDTSVVKLGNIRTKSVHYRTRCQCTGYIVLQVSFHSIRL